MAPLYRIRRRLRRHARQAGDDLAQQLRRAAWLAKPRATLDAEIDLGDWGGDAVTVADIDGDGKPELLWLQSQGIFKSELYREQRPFLAAGRGVTCLTATTTAGRVLWRHGEPYGDQEPYCSHASERMVTTLRDRDGAIKIALLAAPDRLLLLDGSNGRLEHEIRLPSDNFALIDTLRRPGGDRLLVGVTDAGMPPFRYGNPNLIFDADLQQIATIDALGSGHQRWIHDVDGDGADEALVGYELFDGDGQRRWRLDAWQDRAAAYQPDQQHVDSMASLRIGDRWHLAIAGSDVLYWIDSDGRTLWQHRPRHAQYALAGHFRGRGQPPVVMLVDSLVDTYVQCHDLNGDLRWRLPVRPNWPMGIPPCLRDSWLHMVVPVAHWHAPDNQPDLMLMSEAGWPYGLDGDGRVALVLPHPHRARKPQHALPRHRAVDFGYAFQTHCADLDGDGVEEILVHDRRYAWIFRPPKKLAA